MSKLIQAIKNGVNNIYHFIWAHIFQRKEPWTYQLCRMMVALGVFFELAFFTLAGFLFYHLFNHPSFLEAVFIVSGLFSLAWLLDHLIDYARCHPENRPND